MAIVNSTRAVSLTTQFLNLPETSGISPNGYWFYYTPVNSNNDTLGASIKPYKWNNALPLDGAAANMIIEGTMPLITQPWEGVNVKYHGSCIEWIGAGVNDITSTQETDAFFFGHLGSLSPATDDDAYYWDRAYSGTGGGDWFYYQYHKHIPSFYPQYENGRQVQSARGWINPDDKAYGYLINTRITVMGVDYQSVLARIHTPSVGGAHNSHNDVTLPTVSSKNYMPCGILKGVGNRFHAFYIAANGAQWDIFVRTYTQASLSFSLEVNLGTYDLADATITPTALTGSQHNYPVRASAGTAFNERIYIPVILNNATTGFDLEIWSFNSLDTIAGGSLQRYVIASQQAIRPDCHLKVFGTKLYATYTDVTDGGVRLKSFDPTPSTWTDEGQVVTNSNTKYVRVHGFEYNSADTKFYLLLSGTALGTGTTYAGPGLYTFELTGSFPGYKHLDYDYTNNAYINRNALANGYLEYDQITSTLTKYTTAEPAGIAEGKNIFEYNIASPKFINKRESILGGNEFYYQGIQLTDGRKLMVGRVSGNKDNFGTGTTGDLLVGLYSNVTEDPHYFAWGGSGDDYITGCWEDPVDPKVWITGYTKSELVDRKDMRVHGFCRNFADGANEMQFVDIATDSNNNIYAVGNHSTGYIILMKFDPNYNLLWQTSIDDGDATAIEQAFGIDVDENDNAYICGSTNWIGEGSREAFVAKFNSTGLLQWTKIYGTASDEYASSICRTQNNGLESFVVAVVNPVADDTTFLVIDDNGNALEQFTFGGLIVNKIRGDANNINEGQFIFAGDNGAATPTGKFGIGKTFSLGGMIKWVRTYESNSTFNDIRNIGASDYVLSGRVGTSSLLLKVATTLSAGVYTITKSWARSMANAELKGVTVDSLDNVYSVGYTTSSGIATMGMNDGLMVKYNSSGTIQWQNAFGHDMDEQLLAVTLDGTNEDNILCVGWSESHSFGRDAIMFRFWSGGFGTGLYHLEGNPGVPYIYQATAISESANTASLGALTAPENTTGTLVETEGTPAAFIGDTYTVTHQGTNNYVFNGGGFTDGTDVTLTLARGGTYTFNISAVGHPFYIKTVQGSGTGNQYNDGVTNNGTDNGTITFTVPETAPNTLYYNCRFHSGMSGIINIVENPDKSNGYTLNDYGFLTNIYDGSFGPNGVFMFFVGYVDLDEIQKYLNTEEHRREQEETVVSSGGKYISYTKDVFRFWQAGTVGDGSADDGNIFGYDVIKASSGAIYCIGQTSGDLSKVNTGASGAYDYVLIEFDPVTEEMEFYQNGTSNDEETYALTELANGKIAYTGRTTGNLGGTPQGGYDIFLGIFDPVTEISDYYSTGSGLDDKGVNIHDVGNNTLAITYSSYGAVGSTTNIGTEDIGVILFNYVTDTWGTAYQTGSSTSEIFEQNGKPSVLLSDGRIAICCSSAGAFADNALSYGFLDICVGILDLNTGTWKKYQVGSGASDFASSIFSSGDKVLVSGYTRAVFADGETNAVFVELDVLNTISAKAAVV